jgi:hypothetical protein
VQGKKGFSIFFGAHHSLHEILNSMKLRLKIWQLKIGKKQTCPWVKKNLLPLSAQIHNKQSISNE